MTYKVYLFGIILSSFLVGTTWAVEIRVAPGDETLAAAVEAASNGDTLVLEDGGFSGNVTVNKSLTIRPVNRATNAVISGRTYINGSDIEVTVQGIKFSETMSLQQAVSIRLLENEWLYGSIDCSAYRTSDGDGTLVIVGNRLDNGSISGISSDGAYIAGNVLLDGSIIADSYVWIVGNEIITNNVYGAIESAGAGVANIIANRVRCNIPYSNSTNCIESTAPSTYIASNIVEVNDANGSNWPHTGLYATNGHATIINNVIRGMPLDPTRSGSAIHAASPSARISGNIVIDYISDTSIPINFTSTSAEVTHNICFNNSGDCPTGEGNLNLDPMFVDLEDYELAGNSPAIDAGPADYGMADLNRTRNDMGVYGGPWSIGQYDAQREPNNYTPYVYPLFKEDSILSGGILEIQALGVARLR